MSKKVSRFQQFRKQAQALLEDRTPASEGLTRLHKFAHFGVLVWRSFSRNRCPVRAAALAYATLLALVPMLAIVMSITSSFLKKEGEDRIDQFIVKMVASVTPPAVLTNGVPARADVESAVTNQGNVPGGESEAAVTTNLAATASSTTRTNLATLLSKDPEAIRARKEIARTIRDFIQNTRSGALGVTGSVLLIFAGISMLTRIEDTFNDIWGVTRGRGWFTRIVLYWGVISLAPMLIVVAVGLATGPHLQSTKSFITAMPFVGGLIFQFLPVVLLCLTFSVFYMLMPNTRVDWRAGLVGGVVGGLLFHINNLLNVLFVSRVVSNFKIYGGLAMIPVLMIGFYFAWLILLFGAQVAYAFQNRKTYLEEKQVEQINQRAREFIALRLATLVGQRFLQGEPPPGTTELADELAIPTRLVQQVMTTLCSARLCVETAGPESGYLPARPMETISCHDLLLAMRATQGQELATRDEPTRAEVWGEFDRIQQAEREVASSVSMLALASRAQRQLAMPQVNALEGAS